MRFLYIITHLFKKYALILLIAISFQATAQNSISDAKIDSLRQSLGFPSLDSLLLINEEAQLYNIEITWRKNYRKKNKSTLFKLFQKIEGLAADNMNPELEMKAAFWLFRFKEGMYSKTEPRLGYENLVKKAVTSGVFWAEIEAKNWFVSYLMATKNLKNIESGIWILKENIDKITKKHDANLSRLLINTYQKLIAYYYRLGDLTNAIIYSKKKLTIESPKNLDLNSAKTRLFRYTLNNIGVYYRELHQLDSSTYYFQKVFDLSIKENDSLWNSVSGGNLGENFYLQGSYQKALPLLQRDADVSIKLKSWGNASNALILIADIYLEKGNFKKAKQVMDQAIHAAHSSKKIKRLGKVYPLVSKYYKTIGKPIIALEYADSTIVVMDSMKWQKNQFYGLRVEQLYNKHQIKIEAQKENKIQNSTIRQRNYGLFFLGLLLFIGYFIFRKSKVKAKFKENTLLNEVDQVTEELSLKKEQLDNNIQEINAQKNRVNWSELKINSDEQWENFLELFEKEHPKFIYRIKVEFSSITAGEIRLLSITRLGLDDITIASILGVNINSVSQTRRRFMRKSNIENLLVFKELIFSI